jgi:hypothetical protein
LVALRIYARVKGVDLGEGSEGVAVKAAVAWVIGVIIEVRVGTVVLAVWNRGSAWYGMSDHLGIMMVLLALL